VSGDEFRVPPNHFWYCNEAEAWRFGFYCGRKGVFRAGKAPGPNLGDLTQAGFVGLFAA
jgi:hypothetical protein